MNKKLAFLTVVIFFTLSANAQNASSPTLLQNYHPVSPVAYEFLKYTEIPVSEYSGIPNIDIPLYQIQEDGISVPIKLSYHAGGIRVSQEASWVGLGWDLNFGSIVQEINDVDDYSTNTSVVKLKPDWNLSPVPEFWQMKSLYSCTTIPNSSYQNTTVVSPPQPAYSYTIFTAYYAPINGDANNQSLGQLLLSDPNYDSEPDIFQANFLGQSLTFVRAASGNIIVQNKRGYTVTKTTNGFCIKDTDGNQYYFETGNSTVVNSNTTGGITMGGFNSGEPNSKMWMITKIITKNKREINFTYTQSATTDNFPNYSEKSEKYTLQSAQLQNACEGNSPSQIYGYGGLALGTLAKTTSQSTETRLTLSSISFPLGTATFTTSARTDMLQSKKLDGLEIRNYQNKLIRSFQFNYNYSDASSVTTNGFTYNTSTFATAAVQRLRLLSVIQNDGGQYQFTYNTTPLPPKNSFGQDFWGLYNGQVSNTSLIPNPARLLISGMADNGNNNSANLIYAQAGILTKVKYPTGGSSTFEYELNQFDNYFVPDFSSTSNTISSGNGLRVSKITLKTDDNSTSKITKYLYENGKALLPMTYFRTYSIHSLVINNVNQHYMRDSIFRIDELDGKGFFSSNPLGSSSGVGYGKVTKLEVDINNNTLGKQEDYFNNNPDLISNSALGTSQLSASLPAVKKRDVPENGTLQKTMLYNAQNTLISKTENSYNIILSDLNYGARGFGYTSLYYGNMPGAQVDATWISIPQTLVGYYPLYDKESLLTQSVRTEYDVNANSLVDTRIMSYDAFDNLNLESLQTSTSGVSGEANELVTYYTHPYDNNTVPGNLLLIQQSRFAEVTNIKKTRIKTVTNQPPTYVDYDKVDHEFTSSGTNVVKNRSTLTNSSGAMPMATVVNFTSYDANANPLEFVNNGQINSMLWDYNTKYVIAECRNAANVNIAATSFEAESKDNFTFSGTPFSDVNAVTGTKAYNLASGTITKTGLDVSKIYKVSYWSKGGAQTVNGITATSGRTVKGYTYYEHIVSSPTNGTITIAGSGTIDELRLYPKGAQLSTYTYLPLVGVKTVCDLNNKISYYEYDASNRLYIIRDQDKNVLKKICYNYAGQAENCINTAEPTTICDANNCVGINKKCVNGFCETGVKKVISSVSQGKNNWTCTYVYEFSDCSQTQQYTETSTSSCPISALCL